MVSFNLEIGLQAIANYRRMNYEFWYALAEFVDNSTQSYANNKAVLDDIYARTGEILCVRIVYDRENRAFRITDTAMGMNKEDLDNALCIARVPADTSGRSKYGMGLKTAACWVGNRWSITTKKYGEPLEYSVEIDVLKVVASGSPSLAHRTREVADREAHYTVLEISDLNRPFVGRTIGKTKEYIRSMYRCDIASGTLALWFNTELLEWHGYDTRLLRNTAGEPIRQDFDFSVDGKRVFGWAGVLAEGKRRDAGFAMLHSGRVVRGAPDAWRPESIFGINRNDLLNQRLIGEINLDDFEVTHTKDNIEFYGAAEDVEEELARQLGSQIAEARRTHKSRSDERGPSDTEMRVAMEALRKELLSPEIVDKLAVHVLPPEAVVREQLEKIAEPITQSRAPDLQVRVNDLDVWVYLSGRDLSPNDPYVVQESGEQGKVIVIVNTLHPYVGQMEGHQFQYHLRECVYDALAEVTAERLRAKIDPDTVKLVKDALLRVPFQIERHEWAEDIVEEDEASPEAAASVD